MKRYFSAFTFTLFLYTSCIAAFLYTVEAFKKLRIKPTNKIALNSISVVQQKAIKKQEKPKKKPKIKPKKVVKKNQSIKPKKPKVEKVQRKIAKAVSVKKEPPKKERPKVQEVKKELKAQPKLVQKSMPKPYKEDYLQKHLQEIIALIQKNMKYPKRAKRFNIQGKVLIEFVLETNGEVKGFKTIQGHRLLKKSAINAIKEASKQFPKVKKTLKLRVPIMYKLT